MKTTKLKSRGSIILVVVLGICLSETIGSVPPARWCTISNAEEVKCQQMKTAFRNMSLTPEIECVSRTHAKECMSAIKDGQADLAAFDAGDAYTAGEKYGLRPIMAEQYPDGTESYVVAFGKTSNADVTIDNLEGKISCHGGIKMAAGWVVTMSTLMDWGVIKRQGCEGRSEYIKQFSEFVDTMSAGEFFNMSCVPGSSWDAYNVGGVNPFSLCDWCVGNFNNFDNYYVDYCARNQGEDYYGNIGALRCLMEGADVAFTTHQTLREVLSQPRDWSAGVMENDYVILCKDGSRMPASDYNFEECHLGKVPSNVIMVSEINFQKSIDAYKNLLMEGQRIFGRDDNEHNFKMFHSGSYYTDLLFSDVTEKLVDVGKRNTYSDWLGEDYLRSQKYLTGCDNPPALYLTSGGQHKVKVHEGLTFCLFLLLSFGF